MFAIYLLFVKCDLSISKVLFTYWTIRKWLEKYKKKIPVILNIWWWWFSHYVVSDSCDPMDCRLPGSSAQGISQARILESGGISFSGDLPDPGIEPASPACRWSAALKADSLLIEPPGKPKIISQKAYPPNHWSCARLTSTPSWLNRAFVHSTKRVLLFKSCTEMTVLLEWGHDRALDMWGL